ncbi:Methionine--tRNA ligase [Metamycoplasma cloacale]|uniref:Methionine--tRNA ligase n=1 Tax=Metamycoplasma cloacale TaxID=92401 RepID=A0A2Z4LM39_9BACT|nr:methionine--tRNA ligase [Metamycoplasma cloacale]AWX42764.1 methionine--tRNA ligase [Metamycoplasma cloacale]VEU79421.1 Methionine--tRNA ligase [Metamycoplasma cloacale]
MNKKTFYISTPIYYPSGNLHIGHLLTTTLAWVYKNYKANQNYDTFFVTGIDEHGQKILKKAIENNLDPQTYVDMQCQKFIDLWKKLDIDYDFFSRTTSLQHTQTIELIFNKMLEKGLIYKGAYEGLYSVEDEEFFTKTQALLIDNQYYHPTSKHLLQEVSEESYFFNMEKFTPWIKEFFETNSDFLTNDATKKELMNNFINQGLSDLSVTRIAFDWGIKVLKNQTPQHVIYVWLDALFNYLTALNIYSDNDDNYLKFWKNGDERVHVLAKEISRFHAIYWPIFLKSLDINLPTKEVIHSWIITPEGKMSKSKGNVIEPLPLIEKYGAEEIKYFFSSQVNINNDFSFSEDLLINVLNADLANNFGNLLNRVAKMVNQSFENGTTYIASQLTSIDCEIYTLLKENYDEYKLHFNEFNADKAFKKAIQFSSKLNEYIDRTEPWKLKENPERLNVVLNTLLNGIYAVNYMLNPVLKQKTRKINEFLNINEFSETKLFDFTKFDNVKVDVKEILFPRIK